jgi:hypothetical protein
VVAAEAGLAADRALHPPETAIAAAELLEHTSTRGPIGVTSRQLAGVADELEWTLLEQLEEAAKTAQIGIIDMEELAQFAEPGDMQQLAELQRQINDAG